MQTSFEITISTCTTDVSLTPVKNTNQWKGGLSHFYTQCWEGNLMCSWVHKSALCAWWECTDKFWYEKRLNNTVCDKSLLDCNQSCMTGDGNYSAHMCPPLAHIVRGCWTVNPGLTQVADWQRHHHHKISDQSLSCARQSLLSSALCTQVARHAYHLGHIPQSSNDMLQRNSLLR